MGLLHEYLRKEIAELHAKGVRLSVIGDYRRLSPDLVSLIEHGMEMTRGNARLNLVLALNYGAQDEIVRATRAIAAAARAGRIDPDKIEAADVDSFLDTRDLPPRSEEHTSELQSTNAHLVCRLLLEKKKHEPKQKK